MEMVGMIVIFIGFFYFFMIRPEGKRKRAVKEMRESLQIGDDITTIGGIMGRLVQVKEDYVVLETSEDRVRVKIAKWGISVKGRNASEQQAEKAEQA